MAKETLDTIEKSLDVIENNLDKIEDVQAYIADQRARIFGSGVVVGLSAGLAVGTVAYILAKRHLQTKYNDILEEERLAMKAYYERHYKQGDFETPATAAEKLGAQVAETAMKDYRGQGARAARVAEREVVVAEEKTEVEVDVVEPTETTETKNIFTENESDFIWDQEQEESKRAANPDEPFIITDEEFQNGENDYEQITLTYYSEDDVLVDQQEKPIPAGEVDKTVGEGNLLRFGHGSRDNRIVYIRNNILSYDFEVVKRESSYSKEVLGFQHSAGGSRKTQKFRVGDDG